MPAELFREVICKCRCGGLLTNNVEIYVTDEECIVILGYCNICGQKNRVEFKLDDLILKCPRHYESGNGKRKELP